jgi:tRNA threonylcarbamoyladenosine modification (KEOPS) complex  Pcc1 subunit
MNQLEQMQAMQIIQMMQAMPGQEIVVTCPSEDVAEQIYKNVLEVIESATTKTA